jgi:site-specific DNA recombinase
VSTRGQAEEGYSLRQQIEALRTWCGSEGYEVLEEVEDKGYSGASLERPGLERVRDLVQGGSVAVVVAQDADRITREPIHRGLLDDEFERYGTRLVALDDWGDDSHEGQLLKYIKSWVSKGERLKMVERSRRGKIRKVREGRLMRGPRPPYGFTYTEDGTGLVVSEPQMGVVRRIFEMLGVEGLTIGEVERRLNGEGVSSPMADDPHQENSGL